MSFREKRESLLELSKYNSLYLIFKCLFGLGNVRNVVKLYYSVRGVGHNSIPLLVNDLAHF